MRKAPVLLNVKQQGVHNADLIDSFPTRLKVVSSELRGPGLWPDDAFGHNVSQQPGTSKILARSTLRHCCSSSPSDPEDFICHKVNRRTS